MKKIFAFALSTVILGILICSCGAKNAYRNDLPCADITVALEEQLAADGGYVHYGETELKYLFGDGVSLATDLSVTYSLLSSNIDEFGVFKAENEKDARKLSDVCREYLEEKNENETAFISSYAPTEAPKLADAEVKVFGNYAVYAILDENDRAKLFQRIEGILKAES